MRKKQIHSFFTELDRQLKTPAEAIVTGAAAASLMGYLRPSQDIDFEIRFKEKKGRGRGASRLESAVRKAEKKAGVAANYSSDISHWSMIDYLNYRTRAIPYRVFGRLNVRVISPAHWTIGKLARFFEIDALDLRKVLKKKKLRPGPLIELWARVLRKSPLSLAKGDFRDHAIDFLKTYGKKVWGKDFDTERAVQQFKRAAKIA